MSLSKDDDEEVKEEVRLTAAEVKKYKAQFSQLEVQFSSLQLNECIGKGIIACVCIHYYIVYMT